MFSYLTDLPTELQCEVFSYLPPKDLRMWRLTSWRYKEIVTPILFRAIVIDLQDSDLYELLKLKNLLKVTKELIIRPKWFSTAPFQLLEAAQMRTWTLCRYMVNLEAIKVSAYFCAYPTPSFPSLGKM